MKRWNELRPAALALLVLLSATGCREIGGLWYAANADRTKKVPAEYADLAGKRVCVWVWADDAILFDHARIRLDVANHVKFAIGQHVECDFVAPAVVDKFQRANNQAEELGIVQVGRRFDADVVLFIQITEFRTRPLTSPSSFQGVITSHCALYDCKGTLPADNPERRQWSEKITITFPEGRPWNMTEADDFSTRSATLQVFGQALAKKFYTHRVPLGG